MRRLACVLPAAFLASTAVAQPAPDAVRALDQLDACTAIRVDAERLVCFDRVAAPISAARRSGALLAFDRKVVEGERRSKFGLADAPANAGEDAAKRAAAVRELSSTITGVTQGGGMGRWNLTLANGQVWQMMEEERYGPRAGASIRLITTVTGGFRASIDRARPVQVKRIR